MSEISIPVNFKSSTDSTGHYKKITITVITDSSLTTLQARVEQLQDQLKAIDGRDWTGSLPYTVV